jgi:glyoxylase-like metal-dependent hydrolase (beta-lactamase superfamily II)
MTLQISRRHFLSTTATAAAATCFTPHSLFAQAAATAPVQPPVDRLAAMRAGAATARIATTKLRGNISILQGSGGNIAVLPGPQGKLLVDSGFSTSQPQITEALAAISADPIQHLIDTHWHFDHTDGNEWMHAAGATIIAHERCRQRLSTDQFVALFNMHVPALPAAALPTKTFSDTHTLKTNGNTIILTHFDPAHTDTDISVHFADSDILHCGDTWFNGMYPVIDYSTGGNVNGMIRASERNLSTGTGDTIVIPGHGPIGNKTQLKADHDMLVAIRDNVAALKKQGKTVEEAIAAKPTARFDAAYAHGLMTPDTFTRLVYQGV